MGDAGLPRRRFLLASAAEAEADMFDFAWSEIALIGVVALIAIGPKDMPVAIKAVAEMIKKARRMAVRVPDPCRRHGARGRPRTRCATRSTRSAISTSAARSSARWTPTARCARRSKSNPLDRRRPGAAGRRAVPAEQRRRRTRHAT